MTEVIREREQRVASATALARHHQGIADDLIAAELATKSYRVLAGELGTTVGHVRAAKRRFDRRKAESAAT